MDIQSPPERVKQLFHAALECEPHERPAFLADACAGDAALRQEVESLLSLFSEHQDFLQSPVFELSAADVAAQVLAEDEEPSMIGQLIGPYRLIRKIGHGGMGAVYLAARDDGHYDQQVALKLIKRGMDSEEVLRRFRRERQILANLAHANISRLLDGGMTTDGRPYFVMEYVEGLRIDEYANALRLSTAERLEVFLAVCVAVQYAHRHNIIHRDIKPGNILITADGTPKLVDFGIAKLLDSEHQGQSTAETATALRLLTPEYASPEQLRGLPLSAASDVYSLGVVLYELLTGHRPYSLKSRAPAEILEAVMKAEPQKPSTAISSQEQSSTSGGSTSGRSTPEVNSLARDERLSTLRRELRGDLDNIALMALSKEPERRYPSVEAFAADIRGHLDGLPITARKDTFVHRSSKFLERARPAAILTLVVALLVGGSYPTFLSIRAAYTATSTGRHKTRESIAVLPFANGVDPTTEHISDEITDVLIDRLSRVPRLAVPAHDSVSRFKGQTVDPKSIGRELGVATVLTGSIMFDGENFVVDAELFDTSNGQKIWSKQYSGKTLKIQFICEDMLKQLSLAMSNA